MAPSGGPVTSIAHCRRNFEDVSRVLLIDDDEHKGLPNEAQNLVLVPRWHPSNP